MPVKSTRFIINKKDATRFIINKKDAQNTLEHEHLKVLREVF